MFIYESCWRRELAKTVTDPAELLSLLKLESSEFESGFTARKLFAVRAPRPFIAKMKMGDKHDPLFKQVMTDQDELNTVSGFVDDPLQEHDSVLPGLLHKYKSRVLFMLKTGCAINCRYCFRRHFPYQDNHTNKSGWQTAIDYIQAHPEINEVVLSGGDPLMASDEHIADLFTLLAKIPHLTRVRFHTRLPVVIPQRITPALTDTLTQSRFKIIMVFHINHANEIDDFFTQHLLKWQNNGITLLNQAVLLKGVNDSVGRLVDLSERLFEVSILPYYIHLFDKVAGAAHFYLPDEQVAKLQNALRAELPGFLVPTWVREEAGHDSKSPIILSVKP